MMPSPLVLIAAVSSAIAAGLLVRVLMPPPRSLVSRLSARSEVFWFGPHAAPITASKPTTSRMRALLREEL
jgi:hypothetical protein